MDLQEDISRVYQGLQHLDMMPTKNNLAIVLDALQVLEEINVYLQQTEEVETDGNAAENNPD